MKKLLFIAIIMLNYVVYATDYYVSTTGNDKSDGLTEATAWRTISFAAKSKKLKSGDTVWIKTGNYGNENVVFKVKGSAGKPVSYVGYKNKPGDIKSMYYSYAKGKKLDAKQMPMLDGGNRGNVEIGIDLTKMSYITLKNIQVTNYSVLVKGGGITHHLWLENILVKDAGNDWAYSRPDGAGYGFIFSDDNAYNNTFKNCTAINGTNLNFRVYGNYNLIDGCKSYGDEGSKKDGRAKAVSTDYYILIRGSNNIVRNCYLERVGNLNHFGHGISLKSVGVKTENNLVENLEIVGIKLAIEARHNEVQYNTFRNIKVYNKPGSKNSLGGIAILNGASYNVFDRISVDGGNFGIAFSSGNEDPTAPTAGHDNIIKNSIFSNNSFGINIDEDTSGRNRKTYDNKIINSVFYNNRMLFNNGSDDALNNEIINCNISGINKRELNNSTRSSGFKYYNSNFYNNVETSTPSGNGNISVNPEFENASKGNFKLRASSKLINAGRKENEVKKDYDGNNRPQGTSHDIGAFEFQDSSTGSTKANAGEDVSICTGEKVTLTATGGSSYEWSTGQTTASITVSPSKTENYSVTIKKNGKKDSDDVKVIVNAVPVANAGVNIKINEGESYTLSASGGDTYLWSTGETTKSITVSPASTENYTVTAYKNGCEDTDGVKVTVNKPALPEVIANAGEDVSICAGEKVTLTATGGSSYEWSTGQTTASITVSPSKTEVYSVKVKDNGGSDSDDIKVSVNASPVANAGPNRKIDEGGSVTITAKGGDTYLWSTGETTKSITVSPASTENYTVTAYKNGCEDSDGVKVTVNKPALPEVIANAGEDVSICAGEKVTLTATGGSSYEWSTGQTTASITVSPSKTEVYSVKVKDNGGSDSDDIKVSVNASPVANAGPNRKIDEGGSVTITAKGGDTYLWSTGETTKSITVSPASTENYTVTAYRNGCEDSDGVKVTVNKPSVPEVIANAGEDVSICAGEKVILTASGGSSYEWNTGQTTASITVSPSKTEVYSVKVKDNGGSDSDDIKVTVNASPVANAGTNKTIEKGTSVTLTASGGNTYLWSTGETTKSIKVSPNKTKIYAVSVYRNGCEDTDKLQVSVIETIVTNPPPAKASAGDDVTICTGESITLSASGGKSYLWNTGDTNKSIHVSPTRTTTYTLKATRGGITNSDTVIVTVENCNNSAVESIPENSNNPFDDQITLAENQLKEAISVFPNPTSGLLNVNVKSLDKNDLNVVLFSSNGSVVYTDKMNSNSIGFTKQLDLSNLAKGIYFVKFYNDNQNMIKKILVI